VQVVLNIGDDVVSITCFVVLNFEKISATKSSAMDLLMTLQTRRLMLSGCVVCAAHGVQLPLGEHLLF